jgi:multiple sugar transport system substrate-binding protein
MYGEPSRTPTQDLQVAEFKTRHPNIDIKLTRTDFGTYYAKLATAIASGNVPDVFMMSGAYFYQAAQNKALMDLTGRIKSDGISYDDYFGTPTGEDVVFDGKFYGVPQSIDGMALAYNEDLFEEAGLDLPTPGWTWEQLLHAAQELTKTRNGKQQYGFYSRNSAQEVWSSLVYQNGGSFLDETLTRCAINKPAAVEAVQFAVDLIHKYKVSPEPLGVSSMPGYIESTGNPFLTGLIGMKFQGSYEMGVLNEIKDFSWNVTQMPRQKNAGGTGWYQSFVVGANTKHPDESWELLKFLVGEDGQGIMAKDPAKGQTPALISAAQSSEFQGAKRPDMGAWTDGWADHFAFEHHPAWLEYQGAISKALDSAFNANTNVKSALDGAATKVNSILDRYPWFDSSKLQSVAWPSA